MNRNQKLEHLISGREISKVEKDDTGLLVELNDGAKMHITGPENTNLEAGKTIKEVWQAGTLLRFGYTDGKTVDITLGAETSSVFMRNHVGGFIYSD